MSDTAMPEAAPDGAPGASPDASPNASPDASSGVPSDPSSSPPDVTAAWDTVHELVRWLDQESVLPPEQERLLRILKLSEEAGEVAQAVIGATGQNPRKGHSHTWDDVQSELCDVIVTAMVALTTLTPDAREVFAGHLRRVAERSAGRLPAPTSGDA